MLLCENDANEGVSIALPVETFVWSVCMAFFQAQLFFHDIASHLFF